MTPETKPSLLKKYVIPGLAVAVVALAATFTVRSLLKHEPVTLTVKTSIQSIVDEAREGDTIIVPAGTYEEAVEILTPNITLKGELDTEGEPATTILGGGEKLFGIVATADNVVIENFKISGYTNSGIMVTGAGGFSSYQGEDRVQSGYKINNIVVTDNGQYGIYAFQAEGGAINNITASGHFDSGIYIGQCNPCNVKTTNSRAFGNDIGFYATNASVGVLVENSTFEENRVGVVPNSQNLERLAPQSQATIRNNIIRNNAERYNPKLKAIGEQSKFSDGIGVLIGGSADNVVENNTIEGHQIGVLIRDNDGYPAKNNTIEGNTFLANEEPIVSEVDSNLNCTRSNVSDRDAALIDSC